MKKKSLLVTACVIVCMGTAYGENPTTIDSYDLDGIVVTATRTLKNIQSIPSSVSVVTEKDIKNNNYKTVSEALQNLPGLYLSQTTLGGVSMRGFGSGDILVLVDGVPMSTTYNNNIEWEMLPLENVERIEVVRGAGSSLYGGHAVGGVIQIFTKKGTSSDKKFSGDAFVSYGSHNTRNIALNTNFKANDKMTVGVSYNNRESDGFITYYYKASRLKAISPKDKNLIIPDNPLPQLSSGTYIWGDRGTKKWASENISAYVDYKINSAKTLTYRYAHTTSTYQYINPHTNVFENGKPVWSGTIKVNDKQKATMYTDYLLGYDGLKITEMNQLVYNDEDDKLNANFSILNMKSNGFTQPDSATMPGFEGSGENSFYPGKTINFDMQKAFNPIGKHTLLAGISYKQESFDQRREYLTNWRNRNSIDMTQGENGVSARYGGKTRDIALYVQDEYKINDKLTAYGGLRLDNYKKYDGYAIQYDNPKNPRKPNEVFNETFPSATYTELSPKLSLEYHPNDDTNYYITYGHSFNPPALYQIFRYGGAGMGAVRANPGILPEKSDTLEIGMKKSLNDKTDLSLAIYKVNTKNKVAYIKHYNQDGTNDYKLYDNVGREDRHGVELSVDHRFNDNLSMYANYSWAKGKLKQTAIANTNVKDFTEIDYYVPRHIFHAGLNYKQGKWNTNLDMQYVSARQAEDIPTGEYGSEDPYFLVNAAINYAINDQATVQFAVNNIFDRKFYASEGTDGRTFALSMRYKF